MHRKHMFWMILCCAVPLVGIAILPLLGVSLKGGIVPLLLVLVCPLSHLLMMRGMREHDHPPAGVGDGQEQPPRRKLTKLGI